MPVRAGRCKRAGKYCPGCAILGAVRSQLFLKRYHRCIKISCSTSAASWWISTPKYLIDLFGNRGLEEEVYDLTFGSREWRLLDAGRITRREANERMLQRARAVGRGFEVEGVLDDWMSMLRPRRRMQTLVEQLKQRGYCVYYLSNIPEDVLDLLMHRDFEGLFDGGVASCEVKINKPDPRIYQALLDKYHLRADECIFIDDRADNLVAASALGFGIYEMHNIGTLLRSLPTFGVSLH